MRIGFRLVLLPVLLSLCCHRPGVIVTAPAPVSGRDSCVADRSAGCIYGAIADENGQPVEGIEVGLLAAETTGDARRHSRKYEWTDSGGKYVFNQLEPGEYLVSIHYYHAPDVHHPFATAFYPGVENEGDAERVVVNPALRTNLSQLRLQTLPLATIKVKVVWPDGSRPKRSNLLFHNLNYPSQAVIGDVAPQIDDGDGEFTLPAGFEYYARAKLDCDAGTMIETRESRPVQQIKVGNGATPPELVFIIPGPPCELWQPR